MVYSTFLCIITIYISIFLSICILTACSELSYEKIFLFQLNSCFITDTITILIIVSQIVMCEFLLLPFTSVLQDMCVINCCCWKDAIQMPMNCLKEDCCTNTWFCCHSECGLKDVFNKCQWYCIKVETGIKIGT